MEKLIRQLEEPPDGGVVCSAMRRGPAAMDGRHRQNTTSGRDGEVVAPSLPPRKPGDRVKTARRDGLNLARLLRPGELTAVWVPDREQETMVDLIRARKNMKAPERKARQQLSAFVLRHGHNALKGKTAGSNHSTTGWSCSRSRPPGSRWF